MGGADSYQPKREEDSRDIVEETWTSSDGVNVFEQVALSCQYKTLMIPLSNIDDNSGEQKTKYLKIRSMTRRDMTPLDMNFNKSNKNEDEEGEDHQELLAAEDEFYDGTGHLVWLASIAFATVLAMKDSALRIYVKDKRICELGCGAGAASISALLLGLPSHALLTDNDQETIELCQTNCELNFDCVGKEQKQPYPVYSCQLFSWGEKIPIRQSQSKETTTITSESLELTSHFFDTVLAADCVYDIKMIPPLIESAATILTVGGTFILSHVPRFCLPRRDDTASHGEEALDISISATRDPHLNLEDHIVRQVCTMGFHLVETIRPHEVLNKVRTAGTAKQRPVDMQTNNTNEEVINVSIEELRDAHAVIFVFSNEETVR